MTKLIDTYWILSLGFLAQCFFGMRIAVQWWLAEKKRQNVSPVVFWNLSLAGSLLFLIYGALRHDLVIALGQFISYFIYIRNLQLKSYWRELFWGRRLLLLIFPFCAIACAFIIRFGEESFDVNWALITWLGLIGQAILNTRFIYQWYVSEKYGESILPSGFWWLSVFGATLLIFYAFHRNDPVILLSQAIALVPYVRNIMLSQRTAGRSIDN
jgi:lipid-A-disaccharide synthase-like uncharacterized protein